MLIHILYLVRLLRRVKIRTSDAIVSAKSQPFSKYSCVSIKDPKGHLSEREKKYGVKISFAELEPEPVEPKLFC